MEENGIRAEVDVRSEKLGYKIREARMDKVPYMIIVGENEKNNTSVSVRQRDAEPDEQDINNDCWCLERERFVAIAVNCQKRSLSSGNH